MKNALQLRPNAIVLTIATITPAEIAARYSKALLTAARELQRVEDHDADACMTLLEILELFMLDERGFKERFTT